MRKSHDISAARMGTAPVGPLLLSCSVPMMISMLVQALYNVVDSIFVSHINEAALSAVSLAFPLQNLMIAFAVGTGVGVNAHLSRSLGEGNQAESNRAAANGIVLSICTAVVFILFGLFGVRPFMESQTSDPLILKYGVDYLTVCCVWGLGLFVQCMLEKILAATGRTSFAMFSQLIGAVINIIFDPIFIFGLFGAPRMDAAGAAIATVMGQWIGACCGIVMNLVWNKDVQFHLKNFRPSRRTVARIYTVGVPSIALSAIGSVMTFLMNSILIAFSSTAVAVFGVYFKLQSFVLMPVFGLNNGMVPIVSYNYGAHKPERIIKVFKLAGITATCITFIGFLLAQFIPGLLLSVFNASDDMLAMGAMALRIISIHFILAGLDIVMTATFQALGKGLMALCASLIRQLVVLIPVAWLLSLSGNVNMVWWSFPIAELFSLTVCTIFTIKIYREILKPMMNAPKAAEAVAV